ncbi:MAG: type IV pili twitching motility protein PilT, partial [Candidatus Omnitrophica bacterium]|nr:type IV pili twitching motility protein PilT [Candidatus Omnitrophota bacterium]
MEIRDLLLLCIKKGASDLHITENEPPVLRFNGKLSRAELEPIQRHELKKMIYGILSNPQKEMFEKNLELDFSLALPDLDRFRANIHIQKGCVEAAFRRIPLEIPT